MEKIYFQGTFGAYSHLAALSIAPKAKIIPCKTFDECFLKASEEPSSRIIIPESNRITGNIGIEYLVFKYRLNIYSEYFQKIEHNLLVLPGTKISDIKNIYSHSQALSQCSNFIKSKDRFYRKEWKTDSLEYSLGGILFELMKPEEVSIYSDSIKQRGEGVAEIIFEVSNIQNEIDMLNAKGTQILIVSDTDKMATIQSGLKGNILTRLIQK